MESLSSEAAPNLFQRRVKVEAIDSDFPIAIDLFLQNCQELARTRGSLSPTLGCEGKIVCAVSISAISENLNILRIDSHPPNRWYRIRVGSLFESALSPCCVEHLADTECHHQPTNPSSAQNRPLDSIQQHNFSTTRRLEPRRCHLIFPSFIPSLLLTPLYLLEQPPEMTISNRRKLNSVDYKIIYNICLISQYSYKMHNINRCLYQKNLHLTTTDCSFQLWIQSISG